MMTLGTNRENGEEGPWYYLMLGLKALKQDGI